MRRGGAAEEGGTRTRNHCKRVELYAVAKGEWKSGGVCEGSEETKRSARTTRSSERATTRVSAENGARALGLRHQTHGEDGKVKMGRARAHPAVLSTRFKGCRMLPPSATLGGPRGVEPTGAES